MSTKPKASKQPAKQASAALLSKQRSRKTVLPPFIEPVGTKKSRLIALLHTSGGCTIAQMTELTGWQPHTVRGVISAVLRKKLGLHVVCEGSASGNTYKIAPAAR